MANDNLARIVLRAFGSEFSFYLKAHGFHWNVVGEDFQQLHILFGDIYSEVYDSIDDFAEKIRALQVMIPASLTGIKALSGITDEVLFDISCDDMIAQLYNDSEKMVDILKIAYLACNDAAEFGFANFLADRMDAHRKHSWKLRSSMEDDETMEPEGPESE